MPYPNRSMTGAPRGVFDRVWLVLYSHRGSSRPADAMNSRQPSYVLLVEDGRERTLLLAERYPVFRARLLPRVMLEFLGGQFIAVVRRLAGRMTDSPVRMSRSDEPHNAAFPRNGLSI